MKRKTLGIIGGVGPLSTAYFMEAVISMTDASTDQEHIDMVVLNHTEIPDRTDYILDHSLPNPLPMMKADAIKLQSLGVDVIVTPCNTAHYFYEELSAAVTVPFLNMITETAEDLAKLEARSAGILATNGTVRTELFQRALLHRGIQPVLPRAQYQQYVMDIIYENVKAGKPVDQRKWQAVVDEMKEAGCDRILLGCTELSVLKREFALDSYFVDALEVLAKRTVEACGRKIRPQRS